MAGQQVNPVRRGALYVKPADLPVLISAPEYARHQLMAEIAKRERAGELERIDRTCFWDDEAGRWRIRVRRLAPPAPRYRRAAVLAVAVTAALTALLAAGWWALVTLAALPGLTFLGMVFVAFTMFVLARHGRQDTSVSVLVDVSVKR